MVIFDNLNVHKNKRAREMIEAKGVWLLFLPRCFPDFNRIEKAFSKSKNLCKRKKHEALIPYATPHGQHL